MLASRITRVVQVDGDEGGKINVVIRKLTHVELERARKAKQSEVAATAAALGPEMIKAFADTSKEKATIEAASEVDEAKEREKKRVGRFQGYDRMLVLSGVVSWDATRPNPKEGGEPLPLPVKENLAQLDEASAVTLFEGIVDLSDPMPDEADAATSKG